MADSLYKLILTDFESLATVALPNWTIAVRKQIVLLSVELAQLPMLIIVPMFEQVLEETFENETQVGYQVGAALIWEGNRNLETLGTILDTLQDFEEALYVQSLPNATFPVSPCGVFDSDMDMNPTFDISGLPANVDYALRKFTYKAWKARN